MVMLKAMHPVPTYELIDDHGRTLGNIVQPRTEVIIGAQAATVLLRRPSPMLRGVPEQA